MSRVVKESTRTYTVRDSNGVKTVTERTVTTEDGVTTTYKEEKTEGIVGGGGGTCPMMSGGSSSGAPAKPLAMSKSSGGQAPSGDMKEFREQGLKAHNDRRKKHGVPPMKLNNDLNKYAQEWADHLVKTSTFQHSNCTLSNGERVGENIAQKWSSAGADFTGEEATEMWYSEISKHDYKSEQSMGTGHFTQVVWKDSVELGLGKAKSSDGKCFVVGSYRPAGNFIGQFTKNVFPPK
ncbi:hypothetical protein EGW08_020922 [Elysia chlorotica]|uniref:SCP domain-containing protein n=1 Tax=Elysia chlorotica TaxID=188477 RepID=A0A3S0ZN61_ELYCH|nr:hypothetical protein EGW08_020922 [Elysia chlorotica]